MENIWRKFEERLRKAASEKRVLEFCAAINTTEANKLFEKQEGHQDMFESCPSKTQINYCLLNGNQRTFGRYTKRQLMKSVSPNIKHWYDINRKQQEKVWAQEKYMGTTQRLHLKWFQLCQGLRRGK